MNIANTMYSAFLTGLQSNAVFGLQKANHQRMNLLSNPLQRSPQDTLEIENKLAFTSINNSALAKMAETMQESLDKQRKKEAQKLNLYI